MHGYINNVGLKSFIIIGLFTFFYQACWAEITVIDTIGHRITLTKPAKRIIALAPNLTEILFAIGAGKNLVGVSSGSNYPLQAQKIVIVTNANTINLEAILKLQPDLVVAWEGGNPAGQIAQLKKFNIPLYLSATNNFIDITKTIRDLGKLVGRQKQANHVAKQFADKINLFKKKYTHNIKKISVFYEIWQQPLFTVGSRSLINQAINLCGGVNIFAKTYGFAPQVGVEAVLNANPQVIIAGYKTNQWQNYWRQYPQLRAVRHKTLFSINPDLLQRPGPRFTQGVQELCDKINFARNEF